MEEKSKTDTQNSQEEIKLLTFQPQQMWDKIIKLEEEISSLKMEKNILSMIIVDLKNDKRKPISWKSRLQEMLLRYLGGQWEEDK